MRKAVFSARNVSSTPGVEALQRRPDYQDPEDEGGGYVDVVPQPKLMVVVVDEADPHANEKASRSAQYGVLYVERDDDVRDKDVFWYTDEFGQRFRWGVLAQARWNHPNALKRGRRKGLDFGVKQFRIRRGG